MNYKYEQIETRVGKGVSIEDKQSRRFVQMNYPNDFYLRHFRGLDLSPYLPRRSTDGTYLFRPRMKNTKEDYDLFKSITDRLEHLGVHIENSELNYITYLNKGLNYYRDTGSASPIHHVGLHHPDENLLLTILHRMIERIREKNPSWVIERFISNYGALGELERRVQTGSLRDLKRNLRDGKQLMKIEDFLREQFVFLHSSLSLPEYIPGHGCRRNEGFLISMQTGLEESLATAEYLLTGEGLSKVQPRTSGGIIDPRFIVDGSLIVGSAFGGVEEPKRQEPPLVDPWSMNFPELKNLGA